MPRLKQNLLFVVMSAFQGKERRECPNEEAPSEISERVGSEQEQIYHMMKIVLQSKIELTETSECPNTAESCKIGNQFRNQQEGHLDRMADLFEQQMVRDYILFLIKGDIHARILFEVFILKTTVRNGNDSLQDTINALPLSAIVNAYLATLGYEPLLNTGKRNAA